MINITWLEYAYELMTIQDRKTGVQGKLENNKIIYTMYIWKDGLMTVQKGS